MPGSSGADFSASGAPTQQIEDFSDDTEIVPSSSPADAGLDDEVEEVLVLLPESDSTPFNSTLESETLTSDEYQGDFSQVANAGLRTVNPHSDGAEEDLYGAEEDYEAEYGAEDENVGVIDEIAALANSLDEDILSAEDAPDAGAGHYESERPVGEFDPDVAYHEFDAPRKSRSRLVLTVLTLAAMTALGVVFYPSLIEKFRTPSDSSTAVANASNTGTDPGTGSVDPLETPPDGGSDGTDGGSDPIEDPGANPTDDNTTMVAIRHSVAISMEHGVRWKD